MCTVSEKQNGYGYRRVLRVLLVHPPDQVADQRSWSWVRSAGVCTAQHHQSTEYLLHIAGPVKIKIGGTALRSNKYSTYCFPHQKVGKS